MSVTGFFFFFAKTRKLKPKNKRTLPAALINIKRVSSLIPTFNLCIFHSFDFSPSVYLCLSQNTCTQEEQIDIIEDTRWPRGCESGIRMLCRRKQRPKVTLILSTIAFHRVAF